MGEVGHATRSGRIDGGIGDQNVGLAVVEGWQEGFRFAHLGDREAHCTGRQLPAGNFHRFVGFRMRAEADLVLLGVGSDPVDVGFEPTVVDDERRCRQRVASIVRHLVTPPRVPQAVQG